MTYMDMYRQKLRKQAGIKDLYNSGAKAVKKGIENLKGQTKGAYEDARRFATGKPHSGLKGLKDRAADFFSGESRSDKILRILKQIGVYSGVAAGGAAAGVAADEGIRALND